MRFAYEWYPLLILGALIGFCGFAAAIGRYRPKLLWAIPLGVVAILLLIDGKSVVRELAGYPLAIALRMTMWPLVVGLPLVAVTYAVGTERACRSFRDALTLSLSSR